MASLKEKHSLADGIAVAEKVVSTLQPFCRKIAVCGSIRRKQPIIGDVDVIVSGTKEGFVEALQKLGEEESRKMLKYRLLVDGVSVDVSVVKEKAWGAAMCHATGPVGENIRLRTIAKRMGLNLSQYGLMNAVGELMSSETEESVYYRLGEPYVEPERRYGFVNSAGKIASKHMKTCLSCKAEGFPDNKAVADHILDNPLTHPDGAKRWAVSYLERYDAGKEKSPCISNTEALIVSGDMPPAILLGDALVPPPVKVTLPGVSYLVYWYWEKYVEWVRC